jgi:hypothetical protein
MLDRLELARQSLTRISAADPEAGREILHGLNNLVRVIRFDKAPVSHLLRLERDVISDRVRHFSIEDSRPWRYFLSRGWDNLSVKEYVTIGRVWANEAGLDIDREAKRRKEVLFNWLDCHWEQIMPILPRCDLDFGQD